MMEIICAVIGYLFGCIQTSYIIGRLLLRKDIREHGNGNAGASNATMVYGLKYGIIIALTDIVKGIIPLVIIRIMFSDSLPHEQLISLLYLTGLFVIFGHNFPFFMGFRGGKGTASGVGILFGIDYRLGIIGFLLILSVTLITDYIAIGTMSLLVLLAGYTLFYHQLPIPVISTIIIVCMSVWKHRGNFVEIRNGTEKRVKKTIRNKMNKQN